MTMAAAPADGVATAWLHSVDSTSTSSSPTRTTENSADGPSALAAYRKDVAVGDDDSSGQLQRVELKRTSSLRGVRKDFGVRRRHQCRQWCTNGRGPAALHGVGQSIVVGGDKGSSAKRHVNSRAALAE
jgi:hypothetical protein